MVFKINFSVTWNKFYEKMKNYTTLLKKLHSNENWKVSNVNKYKNYTYYLYLLRYLLKYWIIIIIMPIKYYKK